MTCCEAHRVDYHVPNPCTVNAMLTETLAPALTFSLETNTSPYTVQATGAAHFPAIPGDLLPALSNGQLNGAVEQGMLVVCGSGVPNFSNTISIIATLTPHDRLMAGICYCNGYGNFVNDGDGLEFNSIETYDGVTLLHTQSPLPTIGAGGFEETLFPAVVADVDNLRMWAGRKPYNGSIHANVREVMPVWVWEAALTWACNTTITGRVRPVDPYAGPQRIVGGVAAGRFTVTRGGIVTLTGGNILTQTNGPHEIVFDVPSGVVGTITTNKPANFSNLSITDATPSTILSGNTNQTFNVSWNYGVVGCRPGIQRDGAVFDLATGAEIVDPTLCV